MKNWLLFSVLFALLTGCGGGGSKNSVIENLDTEYTLRKKTITTNFGGSIYNYDKRGNLLTIAHFVGEEGSDTTYNITLESRYDDNGNIIFYRDNSGIGHIIQRTYEYDGSGRLFTRINSFEEGQNTTSRKTIYRYDSSDHLISKNTDIEILSFGVIEKAYDGIDDESIIYHYDNDLLISETHDDNGDGLIDTSISYEYDGAVLLSRSENDISRGAVVYSEYYSDGEFKSISVDLNSDGTFDQMTNITFFHDENGITNKTETEDFNADGKPDLIITVLTKKDNVVSTMTDFDADGKYDYITESSYDNQGNLLAHTIDGNGDGVIDETATTSYEYDVFGNKKIELIDSDTNGSIDRKITYSWEAVE